MAPKDISRPVGHIVFDHDGTMVKTDQIPYVLFDGIRELLLDLKTLGFELYVWTSRTRQSTQESLNKSKIGNLFSEIYCYDDGIPKPDPMGLIRLTEGISKDKILHIGDSYTDLEGAKAYGIEVVLACWNSPDQVDKYKEIADYSALNLSELRKIIKGKFNV